MHVLHNNHKIPTTKSITSARPPPTHTTSRACARIPSFPAPTQIMTLNGIENSRVFQPCSKVFSSLEHAVRRPALHACSLHHTHSSALPPCVRSAFTAPHFRTCPHMSARRRLMRLVTSDLFLFATPPPHQGPRTSDSRGGLRCTTPREPCRRRRRSWGCRG